MWMAEEGCFRLRGQQEQRPEWGHVGGVEAGEPGAGGCAGVVRRPGQESDQGPVLQSP